MTINSANTYNQAYTANSTKQLNQKSNVDTQKILHSNDYSHDMNTGIGRFHLLFGNTNDIDNDKELTQNMISHLETMPIKEFANLHAQIIVNFSKNKQFNSEEDLINDMIKNNKNPQPRFKTTDDAKDFFNNQISDFKQEHEEFGINRDYEINILNNILDVFDRTESQKTREAKEKVNFEQYLKLGQNNNANR